MAFVNLGAGVARPLLGFGERVSRSRYSRRTGHAIVMKQSVLVRVRNGINGRSGLFAKSGGWEVLPVEKDFVAEDDERNEREIASIAAALPGESGVSSVHLWVIVLLAAKSSSGRLPDRFEELLGEGIQEVLDGGPSWEKSKLVMYIFEILALEGYLGQWWTWRRIVHLLNIPQGEEEGRTGPLDLTGTDSFEELRELERDTGLALMDDEGNATGTLTVILLFSIVMSTAILFFVTQWLGSLLYSLFIVNSSSPPRIF